jgi:hypothetical protein
MHADRIGRGNSNIKKFIRIISQAQSIANAAQTSTRINQKFKRHAILTGLLSLYHSSHL